MKKVVIVAMAVLGCGMAFGRTTRKTLCTHDAIYDANKGLLAWYEPNVPGAGYDKVIDLAADFIKNRCPNEPNTGLKLYLVHSWFSTPREVGEEKFKAGLSGSDDGHTPACTYANFVKSFVLGYYPYTGDESYIGIVRECLDRLIDHGTTPAEWLWPNCPYASANPRSPEYFGATHWGVGGRNDGLNVIEPDKAGEMGIEYLNFYKVTGEGKYLKAAIGCADTLAKNLRPGPRGDNQKEPLRSPWPFRVNAKDGRVLEEYSANVICAINLFDELIRLQPRLDLPQEKVSMYQKARKAVWSWLYSPDGPMRSFLWKGYFEDIPNDPHNKNRSQNIPLETARYLIRHPELDSSIDIHVPAIIYWTATAFEIEDMDGLREQFWCYAGMGSHTARYASICALWYERTKQEWFKEQAYRFFNWATYVCDKDGFVIVGPDFPPQYWFTDGYGDYVRHFLEGMAAIPEWAPADEDHLLRSTSVVQKISYNQDKIEYKTFDDEGVEVLRLRSKPAVVSVGGKSINETDSLDKDGWTWEKLNKGGVLRIKHSGPGVIIER
jgi:hypothetical protein